MYVDDLNLVETPKELTTIKKIFENEFEMKDIEKTNFCLGLQIENFLTRVLVHKSAYTKKILKHFYMNEAHPLSSPMVVCSLYVKNDQFNPCEKGDELFSPEVPYLNVISELMYFTNCTRLDIVFSINLLARYSSTSIQRH